VLEMFGLNIFRIRTRSGVVTAIPNKLISISWVFVDLCITLLFLCNSKQSKHASLFIHIPFCS